MDRNKEVAGSDSILRLATRAVGSAALLALGLFAAPAWATCAFTAPTERTSTGANGWDDTSATEGDIVYVVGGTDAVTLPVIADATACDGEGDVQLTLWKDGVQQEVATGASILTLLTVDDDATTDSTITVATTGTDASTLSITGAALTYTAASTPGFHNAAPVAFQLQAEKAFSGGDKATFDFTITLQPAALTTAPTDVELFSETATSIYVEFTGDGNPSDTSDADPTNHTADTTASGYEIEYTYTPSTTGAMPVTRTMTVADTATGITPTQGTATNPRQSATLTGLKAGTMYTIKVKGVRGMGYSRSVSAEAVNDEDGTTPLTITTRMPYYNPRQEPDNMMAMPYKISVGETVDLQVKDLIYIGMAGAAASPGEPGGPVGTIDATDDTTSLDDTEGRGAAGALPTFNFVVSGGSSSSFSVEYLNDGDSNNADDLIRISGLGKAASRTVTLTATSTDMSTTPATVTTLTGTMMVQVLENFAPMFAISEATVDWNVKDADDALMFEIDVMSSFVTDQIADANSGDCGGNDNASNEINCDHTLEFSMSFSRWFEIDEDTGVISVKGPSAGSTQTAEEYLEAVKEGDQYELTVTATDQNDAEDEMTIFVDVVGEDNDAPKRRSLQKDIYLNPLTEANGGGYRTARGLRSQFSDEEGDDLCFEIRTENLDDTDGNTLAEASLGGASSCQNDTLTISMNLPSTDPEDDNFVLLGKYGTETVSVTVGAYERGSTPRVSTDGAVTISVRLVYGQNEGPSIRSVAQVTSTSTYVTSGTHEIDEGSDIRLTFTADDAQPTGDALCWRVGFGSCTPCTGSPDEDRTRVGTTTVHRRSSNRVSDSGVSHEYDLIIAGTAGNPWTGMTTTVTDYERYDGVYTVRLCASDLAGETHRITFDVKLKDVEEAPELDDIDPLYMVVGDDAVEVDLSDSASDGDGNSDIASYDANCIVSCRSVLTVSEADGVLTITPTTREIGEEEDNDSVTVEIEASVTDSTGMTAYTTMEVTVKDRNTAPSFDGGLAAVSYTMPENSRGYSIGEPLAISDSDDDGNTLSVSTSSKYFSASRVRTSPSDAEPEDVTYGVQIRSGSGPTPGGFDFESDVSSFDITVTVQDRYGGRDNIEVRVDLTDVNEKPVIVEDSGDIEDQKILVGVTRCVVDASEHFEDPDHRDQQAGLYIEASTTRPSDARVEVVDNNMICVTGLNVGSGAGRVKVTATDREDEQVSKTFRLTVEANMPPTVVDDGIPDMMVDEGGRTTEDIDLNMYFDDGDMLYEEDLSFDFSIDNPNIATGALVGEDMLRIYGDAKGTAMVTVTATDEDDQSVSDTFEIEVTKNDPPVPNPDAIDDVVTRIGLEEDPIDARDAFTDEGDTLRYSVETGDPDVATAAMKYDEEGGPWIVIHSHSPGNTDCTLTARDSADNSAKVEFSIEVGARNDAPTVANAIDDVTLEEGDRHDIDLEDVFEDEAALDIEVENEDESVADVVHRRSANEIRVYANMAGTTTVTVTATDNVGQTATDEFEVTVEAVPEAVGAIADQTLQIGGEDLDLNVSEYFSYTDGVDLLSYTVTTDGSAAANISNIGSLLTMSPFTRGSTEVTVTATDPRGKTAVQTFNTIVSDSEIRAVAVNALAGYGRAILSGVSQAIGARLESNRSETGFGIGEFARFAPTDDVSYTAGTSFSANQGVMGFGHVGSQAPQTSMGGTPDFSNFNLKSVVNISNSFSKNLNGNGGVGTWSFWSTRDARNFSGEGYEGSTSTTFMGLDILANKNWLVGVTASNNTGTSQYSWGTASQTMDTELMSVMPYFNFEPSSKTSLWGVVGYGSGDITSTVVNASDQSSDLSMNLGMLGGRQELAQAGILQLAVRGDAGFANLASADGSGAVDDLSASVHRVRAGLEGSLTFALANGRSIKPFGEVAFRNDGGDGLTGSGVEVGGGIRVETNSFTIEARGHKTASHSAEDFSESGFSIHAEIAQSADGSGFALTATPRWTQSTGIRTASSVVWDDAATPGVNANALQSMRQYGNVDGNPLLDSRAGMAFDTALKYGFRINNDRYLVTPFIEAQSYSAGSVTSLIGLEFKQLMRDSRVVDMRFVIGRNDDTYGSDTQLGVNARIQF